MPRIDPIEGFTRAEDVAGFLLHEAFHHAHEAASYEVASDLFAERIMEIAPAPGWETPEIPSTLTDWLARKEDVLDNVLDPVTSERMSHAWYSSLADASTSGRRFARTRKLQSLGDIVGHVVNLTLCLEAILNRHLYLLRESGLLDPDHYIAIDRAELMPKLLFCFKEDLVAGRLRVGRIKQLVTFRNRAVHYRVDSVDALAPSAEDLLAIWREFGQVLARTTGEPTEELIRAYSDEFVAKWILT